MQMRREIPRFVEIRRDGGRGPLPAVLHNKCGMPLTTSEVEVEDYRDMKKKVTELEIKLYAVRKELKNCYENCFGAVGDHADTGA